MKPCAGYSVKATSAGHHKQIFPSTYLTQGRMLPSFIQQTHIKQLLCAGSCIRKHRLSLLSARVYLIVLQGPHRGSPQPCLAFSLEPGWPFCFPQWLGVLNAISWIQLSAGRTEMTFFFLVPSKRNIFRSC